MRIIFSVLIRKNDTRNSHPSCITAGRDLQEHIATQVRKLA